MRKESIVKSVNDLRQMFAQVAVNLHETVSFYSLLFN